MKMNKHIKYGITLIALIIIFIYGMSLWLNQNNEMNDIASNDVFCEMIGYDKSVPSLVDFSDFYVWESYLLIIAYVIEVIEVHD